MRARQMRAAAVVCVLSRARACRACVLPYSLFAFVCVVTSRARTFSGATSGGGSSTGGADDDSLPPTPLLLCLIPGRMKMPLRYVDVPVVITAPTFASRAAWLCYSAACALGDALEQAADAGTLPPGVTVAAGPSVDAAAAAAAPREPGPGPAAGREWFSAPPARAAGAVGDDTVEAMEGVLGGARPRTALADEAYGPGPAIARRASYCLLLWARARASGGGGGAGSGGVMVPDVLLPFEAGWPLATALWVCVDILERSRLYGAAIAALEQLLECPYTPHRRGRWYNRLSIDLCHVSDSAGAAGVCDRALRDARVSAGDRVTLARRGAKLRRALEASVEVVDVASDGEGDGGVAAAGAREADDEDDDDAITGAAHADRPGASSVIVPGAAQATTPYAAVIHEAALRARGGAPTPIDVTFTEIVARPLNREVGKKSRFISTRDALNGSGGGGGGGGSAATVPSDAAGSVPVDVLHEVDCACMQTWDADDYLADFGLRGLKSSDDSAFRISVEQLALEHYRCVVPLHVVWLLLLVVLVRLLLPSPNLCHMAI